MKRTAILSVGYWFSAYTLGLLLHPYKTMRELVRLKSFETLVVVPVVMWGIAWVVAIIGLRFGHGVLVLLGLVATARFVNILAFTFWWLTFFMLFWQILLGYLWVRFKMMMD
jgi:hypothetical protein